MWQKLRQRWAYAAGFNVWKYKTWCESHLCHCSVAVLNRLYWHCQLEDARLDKPVSAFQVQRASLLQHRRHRPALPAATELHLCCFVSDAAGPALPTLCFSMWIFIKDNEIDNRLMQNRMMVNMFFLLITIRKPTCKLHTRIQKAGKRF